MKNIIEFIRNISNFDQKIDKFQADLEKNLDDLQNFELMTKNRYLEPSENISK